MPKSCAMSCPYTSSSLQPRAMKPPGSVGSQFQARDSAEVADTAADSNRAVDAITTSCPDGGTPVRGQVHRQVPVRRRGRDLQGVGSEVVGHVCTRLPAAPLQTPGRRIPPLRSRSRRKASMTAAAARSSSSGVTIRPCHNWRSRGCRRTNDCRDGQQPLPAARPGLHPDHPPSRNDAYMTQLIMNWK
jgi:hypothetical protein